MNGVIIHLTRFKSTGFPATNTSNVGFKLLLDFGEKDPRPLEFVVSEDKAVALDDLIAVLQDEDPVRVVLCPDEGREDYKEPVVHKIELPYKPINVMDSKPRIVEITDEEMAEMVANDSYTPGYCAVCGATTETVEPDLREGDCEMCGEKRCVKSALVWLGIY